MAMGQLTVRVSVAWWVAPYLRAVELFCIMFGTEPDMDKVLAICLRGVRCETRVNRAHGVE